MKKIITILAVLCLGMVIMPGITNIAGAESYNLVNRLDNGECDDSTIVNRYGYNDSNQGGNAKLIITRSNAISGQENDSFVFWVRNNQIANNTNISSAHIELNALAFTGMSYHSLNVSVYYLYSNFNESEVSWLNRTNNTNGGLWEIAGGFYNPTPIYSVEMHKNTTGWYQFDITTAYRNWVNNGTANLGLIFRCTDAMPTTNDQRYVDFASSEGGTEAQHPKLNITYSGGSNNPTSESTITKDIWDLKGFMGETKLASNIFSEIPNCKAIAYKNSTGYYYTYAPTWGIIEDYNITYGDGLFILTTANTTWDHT